MNIDKIKFMVIKQDDINISIKLDEAIKLKETFKYLVVKIQNNRKNYAEINKQIKN